MDAGHYPVVGGDVCETPTQGVIREVLEESGFIVNNPKLIAVKDRDVHPYSPKFPFHIYKTVIPHLFETLSIA